MIKALLLDADGVTQRLPFGWRTRQAWFGGIRMAQEINQLEKTTLTDQLDLVAVLAEMLDRYGNPCTVNQILQHWFQVRLDHRMLQMVARARSAGMITALATNQQRYRGRWMAETLPYEQYFDHQFPSFEVGLAKPDPAYFQHLLEVLQLDANQAVFVDDLAENVQAARSVGLHAIHFARWQPRWWLYRQLRQLGVRGV